MKRIEGRLLSKLDRYRVKIDYISAVNYKTSINVSVLKAGKESLYYRINGVTSLVRGTNDFAFFMAVGTLLDTLSGEDWHSVECSLMRGKIYVR